MIDIETLMVGIEIMLRKLIQKRVNLVIILIEISDLNPKLLTYSEYLNLNNNQINKVINFKNQTQISISKTSKAVNQSTQKF